MSRSSVIEIAWSSRRLEKSCSSDSTGKKSWGADQWKIFRRRLAALRAAPTLADMAGVPGNCHPLSVDRAGQFAVDLWGPYRLILEPDHYPVPTLPDGGIDETQITKIEIEEVVDYHGK
jgi:proteic killer suppression protein